MSVVHDDDEQMTMAQLEKTMENVRVTCGTKNKVSDEIIDGEAKI